MTDAKKLTRASDFHPEVLKLFDRYVHGLLPRRGFLKGAGVFATLTGVTAVELLDALNPRFAEAQKIAPADSRIKTEIVEIDSSPGNGKVRGLLARPANASGPLPVILVVHENRGLNPHIEDIARRLAVDNFIAFAPDALFSLGGYPATKTARVSFSQSWTRPEPAPISSRPPIICSRCRAVTASWARWASAMAAASSTGLPNRLLRVRGASRLIWRSASPFTARRRRSTRSLTSRANCC